MMQESDFSSFQDKWLSAHEISVSNNQPSANAINQVFTLLKPFELNHVIKAIASHAVKSKFAPTPNDVIAILEENQIESPYSIFKPPSADELIMLARNANTPLGVIAKIKIGSFDLMNQDAFYLKARANEVLSGFDDIVERCINGTYTSHEITSMIKYSVSPGDRLAYGLPAPSPKGMDIIRIEAPFS